jgi:outer membrane receptor for ferrienterochelin and colicins
MGGLYYVPQSVVGDPYRAGTRTIAAGYVQGKLDLWSRLTVTVGSRYDWYSDFGKSINPRAAVVLATPWKSHVKLAYGRAFRAPQIFEIGLSKPSGLKAETVQTLEASYVQEILDIAQATADVFYQKLDNLIIYDVDQTMVNAGNFATKGIELEVRTRDVYRARLMGSYTHLFREANDPGFTPKDFGSVAVDYAWHRLAANVNTTIYGPANQSLSDVFGGPPTAIYEKKAHALFNLRLQAEIAKGTRAFVTANNIFDYRHQPANLGVTHFARGRTFLLGLSADL